MSLAVAWPLWSISPAAAQAASGDREVLLATMDDAGLADLLATPGFLALAQQGGAALLVMTEAGATLQDFGGAFAPSSGGALPDGLAADRPRIDGR